MDGQRGLTERLIAELGADAVLTDADVTASYSRDMMPLAPNGSPLAVVLPGNTELRDAFAFLREKRKAENHIAVRLRASFATWAPVENRQQLRRRVATLAQRIEGWGNCKTARIAGDPLDGVMSSVPGLALASTGNPSLVWPAGTLPPGRLISVIRNEPAIQSV